MYFFYATPALNEQPHYNVTFLVDKQIGQTNSKLFFQADVSSKKRTNEFDFTTMRIRPYHHERGAIIRAVYHVRERRFIST